MLLEDSKKRAMKLLKQLIAISRASGLYVFITTQRPSNDIIDNVVKANINNRIVFKTEDIKNSIVALDKEGAEQLQGKGHGLLKHGASITEFRGYNISDEDVKSFIKPHLAAKTNIKPMKAIENKPIEGKKEELTIDEYQEVIEKYDLDIDLSFLNDF